MEIAEKRFYTYEMMTCKYESEIEYEEHHESLKGEGWSFFGRPNFLLGSNGYEFVEDKNNPNPLFIVYQRPARDATFYRNELHFKKVEK